MGDLVQALVWEDALEKGKATHSSIVAWRFPWTIVHEVEKSRTRLSDFHFHFGENQFLGSNSRYLSQFLFLLNGGGLGLL